MKFFRKIKKKNVVGEFIPIFPSIAYMKPGDSCTSVATAGVKMFCTPELWEHCELFIISIREEWVEVVKHLIIMGFRADIACYMVPIIDKMAQKLSKTPKETLDIIEICSVILPYFNIK